ncbi:MAG: hypothetical protein ICCCNLDF_00808 [Planctomycetes bacterium]|nr:hypothetical protein [Planctomycetota bacterium]
MKYLVAILILAALSLHVPATAQAPAPAAMSAVDIVEALLSSDLSLRDRGNNELGTMSVETAAQLGVEVNRVTVGEAETVLAALAVADTTAAATAACVVLDSEQQQVRVAALDTLSRMKPAHTAEAGAKQLTAKRLEVLRTLVQESDFVKLLCEGVAEDDEGKLVVPVQRAMRLMPLLDRFYGVRAMGLLMKRLSVYMLGDEPGDEQKKPDTQRRAEERLRRCASLWCEAVWVEDPAIAFNYSAIAPYGDRAKAIARLNKKLEDFEKAKVVLCEGLSEEHTFKGRRYGDYLLSVMESDLGGANRVVLQRLRWWSGDDVIFEGEGLAEALEELGKLGRRKNSELRRKVELWWKNHRLATE